MCGFTDVIKQTKYKISVGLQLQSRQAVSDVLLLTCEGKRRNTKGMLRNYM